MKPDTELQPELAKQYRFQRQAQNRGKLRRKMSQVEATRTLRLNLKKHLEALLTMLPTSTENKKKFLYTWDICHETSTKTIGYGNQCFARSLTINS